MQTQPRRPPPLVGAAMLTAARRGGPRAMTKTRANNRRLVKLPKVLLKALTPCRGVQATTGALYEVIVQGEEKD